MCSNLSATCHDEVGHQLTDNNRRSPNWPFTTSNVPTGRLKNEMTKKTMTVMAGVPVDAEMQAKPNAG